MLTPVQQRTLKSIEGFMTANGRSPSFDEICEMTGVASKSGVHRVLTALASRGFIERGAAQARSIRLTGICPCCGRRSDDRR